MTDQNQQAAQFAQDYLVFVQDPRGAKVLANMATINERGVNESSTWGQALFHEGMRAVYLGILQQVRLAQQGPPVVVGSRALNPFGEEEDDSVLMDRKFRGR